MTWKHFSDAEMRCRHCGKCDMDDEFMARLDELRDRCGFPLIVNSGYRCSAYNVQVSSTGKYGPHTTGKAADLRVSGEQAHTVLREALALDFTGVGVSQKGAHSSRFIHLDILRVNEAPRPNVWSY